MAIMTSPALRYARRVTPELHFTGSATSNVDCGAIHNAAAKLWLSLWFELDSLFSSASGADQYLFGKYIDGEDYLLLNLSASGGKLKARLRIGNVEKFEMLSTETYWTAKTWHHVIFSISSAAGARMIANGGTAVTDADKTAVPNGGDFIIGAYADGGIGGILGRISNVAIGTDDLSTAEEVQLNAGIIPSDATDFWRLNEGYGTAAASLGSDATSATIDTACTWKTGLRQYVRW